MKKYIQLNQIEKLQRKLDEQYGKGLYKANFIFLLFGSLSFVSCKPDGNNSVQNTPITETPTPRTNPRVPPNAITITNTGQTSTLNEIYSPDYPDDELQRITDVYFAKKVVTNNTVSFTRIDSAHTQRDAQNQVIPYDSILGKTVYLILETRYLVGEQIDIVLRSSNAQMNEDNDTMQVMFFNELNRTMQASRIKRTRVGNTDALLPREGDNPYTNLGDFINFAIIKLQLRPQTRERFNEWAQAIGNGTANIEVIVERFPDSSCAYGDGEEEVDTAGKFLNDDTARFRVANRNFYEIYHGENPYNFLPMNGQNRRRIAKLESYYTNDQDTRIDISNLVTYFYYDQHDNEHRVCEISRRQIIEKGVGAFVNGFRRNETPIEIIDYTPWNNQGVDARTSHVYQDGTVISYGTRGSQGLVYIQYNPLRTNIYLLELPEEGINYQQDGAVISFTFTQTRRFYTNPNVFAAFLGALARLGIEIESTGSSFGDGSSFPSVAHNNGNAFDTRYFNNVQNDQNFIDYMASFGFNERIIGNNPYHRRLNNNTSANDLHDTHLHCGGLNINVIHPII
jgi:hypothetical protein